MAITDVTAIGHTCGNCGRRIGADEQPYLWGTGVVCPECCASLQAAQNAANAPPTQNRPARPNRPYTAADPMPIKMSNGNAFRMGMMIAWGFLAVYLTLCAIVAASWFVIFLGMRQSAG